MVKRRKRKPTNNQWTILKNCEYEMSVDTNCQDILMLRNSGLISIRPIFLREAAKITDLGKDYLIDRQKEFDRSKINEIGWK